MQQAWADAGVTMHFGVELKGFVGDGALRAVETSDGTIDADLAVICTKKVPNNALAKAAGLKLGPTGGVVVDNRMATSVDGVFAAGDCTEIPLGVTNVGVQGLTGSHAYAQGKVAGINAGGGRRTYQPVYIPWGMVAGDLMIGGVAFGETAAEALGIPYVMGQADGISRARYFPGVRKVRVKLLAEPGTLAADRRPDGRRGGHQGAGRLPGHGRQDRHHARGPGLHGERLLAPDRRAQRADRRRPRRTP